mgnify:CR=1 FL=1
MEKIINLLGIRQRIVLCHSKSIKGKSVPIYMEAISEEEERRIDNSKWYYDSIRWKRSDGSVVNAKDIYLYGEVDINKEEDINYIMKYHLIDDDDNNWMPSNFDYDAANFTTINNKRKEFTTWDAFEWFLYNHVLIGKPKRIIIYKNPLIIKK